MPVLARNKNQITLIYSSLSQLGKQVVAYLQASEKKIEIIDIVKQKLGDTIWVELSEDLKLPFQDIFEISFLEERGLGNYENFSVDDWLKIINNNPIILQRPIAVNGDSVMLISQAIDILKYFDDDSAGLANDFNDEACDIDETTKDEDFI